MYVCCQVAVVHHDTMSAVRYRPGSLALSRCRAFVVNPIRKESRIMLSYVALLRKMSRLLKRDA